MVITKKNTSHRKDVHWFGFSMGLSQHLFPDYIALKLCHHMEIYTLAQSNIVGMVEVVEKSLKMYLSINEKVDNALSHYSSNYGHNLEKLRIQSSLFSVTFQDDDIASLTKPFDDKGGALYQHLRYGSQHSIEGLRTNLGKLMSIVDKVFYTCILRLDEPDKKMVNHSSILKMLIVNSHLAQSNNRDILLEAVQINNPYYSEYEQYCWEIENEDRRIIEQFQEKKS